MNLKEFISNKENNALELVKCGSCRNALVHAGKYEIVKLGQVEGILCETCKHTDRKLTIASKVSDDGKSISQITVQQLLLEPTITTTTTTAAAPATNKPKQENNVIPTKEKETSSNSNIKKEEKEKIK